MQDKLNQLKFQLAQVHDLIQASNLLEWDQETLMPAGGEQARAHQIATLRSMAHRIFTSDEVGALFDDLRPHLGTLDAASDEAAIIRVGSDRYRKQKRVPSAMVASMEETTRMAVGAWQRARAAKDFALFAPHLEQILTLKREYVALLDDEAAHPYDVLLDDYEPGMTTAQIESVFTPLRDELVALVRAVTAAEQVDDGVLRRHYPADGQMRLGRKAAELLGYDFERGRLDLSAHPFTISFAADDVRITTRVLEDFLPSCLMSVIHEAGHALYEQNTAPGLYRIGIYPGVLGGGAGMAAHESQSRFYENVLGRSRAFWEGFLPHAQEIFPEQLSGVTLDPFYRALNRVEPSLIRVEADEVTYGLHIMLRFELEKAIFSGELAVADLPAAWNARMEQYLGITPPSDADGVLQDIHWSAGYFGYFPDYLLGSVFAVQLWDALRRAMPGVTEDVRAGRFEGILGWLRENVHRHGAKFTLPELAQMATGGPLDWRPYVGYLKAKAAEVYSL